MIKIIIKILALIFASKYFNISKTKLFIIYKFSVFLILVIAKSAYTVYYEGTVKGFILTIISSFLNRYGHRIKRFLVYSLLISINLLKVFHEYLPRPLVLLLNLGRGLTLKDVITFSLTLTYNLYLDFLSPNIN